MKLLLARRTFGFVLIVVVIAMGGALLQDGRTAAAGRPGQREARTLGSLGLTAPGRIAFTEPGACELRVFDLGTGRFVDIPRTAGTCDVWAPRVGTRVAYGVPDDCNCSIRHFGVRDLEHPRVSFGNYKTLMPLAWSPDGSRLAWCDTPRSGFELSSSGRRRRLDLCPRAYDPRGLTASVNDNRQIVVGGRPLLRARGIVNDLAWGTDGSLAVLVDQRRVDRYKGKRLVGSVNVPRSTLGHPLTIMADFSPDNCAALSVGASLVRLIDLGCFSRPSAADVQRPVRRLVAGRQVDRGRGARCSCLLPRRRQPGDSALERGGRPTRLARPLTAVDDSLAEDRSIGRTPAPLAAASSTRRSCTGLEAGAV